MEKQSTNQIPGYNPLHIEKVRGIFPFGGFLYKRLALKTGDCLSPGLSVQDRLASGQGFAHRPDVLREKPLAMTGIFKMHGREFFFQGRFLDRQRAGSVPSDSSSDSHNPSRTCMLAWMACRPTSAASPCQAR